ncbi:MAG: META domain-containing protein [Candidatus Pacebacteria bacterium]|nr:META domain-containing protein [Candidatus Paceibacterota bacterium]
MKNNPYIIGGAILIVLVIIFGGINLYDKKSETSDGLGQNLSEINGVASLTASSTASSSVSSVTNSAGSNSGAQGGSGVAVGGQRDGNGCLTGAGYSWDSEIGSCVRSWEKLTTFIPTKKWYVLQNNKVFSKNVFFTIDQNSKISGKVCNSFSGTVKFDNKLNTVTSGPIMSTLMACLDSDISNLESKFFRVLNGTADVSLNTNNGHLTFKKGNDVIEFTTNENEGSGSVTLITPGNGTVATNSGSACTAKGGQWSSQFKECLGVDNAVCTEIGGQFNECASACRNDPNAQVCTMQCVQVCEFK